ncbi:MAG: hypothetical protein ACI308_02220 [Muribaculaceae bacterium]
MKGKLFAKFAAMVLLLLPCQSLNADSKGVEEIIVISKTHFDIGYTHRVSEIVRHYQTDMIDRALNAMDETRSLPQEQQFAWTIPGWVLSKTMANWDGQTEERRRRLDERFRSRQIICHALPFTLITDVCGVEDMVRGLNFSSTLNRQYGLPLSRSCKMTDEPSHSAALPTVLANAGVKFIHIGCNWPSGYVTTPGLFWWQGPDGSRVLTFYSPSYGTTATLTPSWQSPDDPMMGENLLPAKDWKYKVWPAILVTGDNSGPTTAKQIKDLFDDVKQRMPGVKVRMGTMDDFYDAIMRENPGIPVLTADMPDTWAHGLMCDPRGISTLQQTRSLIAAAEALNAQLSIWGISMPDAKQDVASTYENILLYDEHTWGGAQSVNTYGEEFKKLPADAFKNLEASWEDKTNYVRKASAITNRLMNDNIDSLTANVKCSKPSLLVYNPLPYKRSSWVNTSWGKMLVKDVPASGYKLVSHPAKQATTDITAQRAIENEFYRIEFDASRGTISALIDKTTGRNWVDDNAQVTMGQYLNERFTFEQTLNYTMTYQQNRAGNWPHPGMHKPGMISQEKVPYRAASPLSATLSITSTGDEQKAVMVSAPDTARHLPAVRLTVTLCKGMPYFDMEIKLINKAKDNWPEADWLCLPFAINNPQFAVYRQLGVMNPATDIQKGANRHLYAAYHGVTITGDDGAGFAVCPVDHPLVSLGEPGCWKFSNDYVPQKPVVYLNLYNNQWNTNFRYWYTGSWTSRVRMWAIKAGTQAAERSEMMMDYAFDARNPLIAANVSAQKGRLPKQASGVSLSRRGVLVTAFGSDPDGNQGTLLRVWEQAGVASPLEVTLPSTMRVSRAIPVDLRGTPTGDDVEVKSNKIKVNIKAYAPVSFILQ